MAIVAQNPSLATFQCSKGHKLIPSALYQALRTLVSAMSAGVACLRSRQVIQALTHCPAIS